MDFVRDIVRCIPDDREIEQNCIECSSVCNKLLKSYTFNVSENSVCGVKHVLKALSPCSVTRHTPRPLANFADSIFSEHQAFQ